MRRELGIISACYLFLSGCAGVQVGALGGVVDPLLPEGFEAQRTDWDERPSGLCLPYFDDPTDNPEVWDQAPNADHSGREEIVDIPPPGLVFHPGSYTREERCDLTGHAVVVSNFGQLASLYEAASDIQEETSIRRGDRRFENYQTCVLRGTNRSEGSQLEAITDGLDCYADYWTATRNEPMRILIFAHGGMVSQTDAIREAETLAPALLHDGYYPIFLIWNSDFFQAYRNYLCCTNSRGEVDARGGWQYAAARVFGDVGSGVAQIPENILNQGVRSGDAVWMGDLDDDAGLGVLGTFGNPLFAEDDEEGPPDAALRYYLPVFCGPDDDPNDRLRRRCHNDRIYRPRRQVRGLDPETGRLSVWEDNQNGNIIYPMSVYSPYHEQYWSALNGGLEDFPQNTAQYQFMRPVRVFTTAGAELGRNAWDDMIGRTRYAVRVPPDLVTERNLTSLDSPTQAASNGEADAESTTKQVVTRGGFGQLIEVLSERLGCTVEVVETASRTFSRGCYYNSGFQANPNWTEVEITFAGHSMGSLIGNEIIRIYRQFPMERVIYMAAAASVRDYMGSLGNYMANQHRPGTECEEVSAYCTRFFNLMLHPQRESRETNIRFAVPPGSLLEWIDEMFEDPRSSDERTLGKWSNIVANRDLFGFELRRNTMHRVFSVRADTRTEGRIAYEPNWGFEVECDTAGVNSRSAAFYNAPYGYRCHPLVHGEFNDFSFWRDRYLLGRYTDFSGSDEE